MNRAPALSPGKMSPPHENVRRSDVLAPRTVVRPPLAQNDSANSFATARTRFSGPAVNVVLLLITAAGPVRIHIIRYRRTAMQHRQFQDGKHLIMKPLRALSRKLAGSRFRMNGRSEQGFIGIDVTHASNKRLIQQHGLNAAATPL